MSEKETSRWKTGHYGKQLIQSSKLYFHFEDILQNEYLLLGKVFRVGLFHPWDLVSSN